MNIRILYCGIAGGIAAAVSLAVPLYFDLPSFYTTDWTAVNPLPATACGLLAMVVVAISAYAAARWNWVASRRQAAKQGALAGLVASLVAYMLVGVSAAGVVGASLILQRGTQPVAVEDQAMPLLTESVVRVVWHTYAGLWSSALAGSLLGAVGGWFAVGRRWGTRPAPTNDLIQHTTAMLTLLASSINLLITAGIAGSLSQHAQPAAEQGITPSLSVGGVAAWPLATVVLIFLASIWWNWRWISSHWINPLAIYRRNARGAASITIVVSILSIVLLFSVVPHAIARPLTLGAAFGVIVLTAFGVRNVWSKTAVDSSNLAASLPAGRDWLEHALLLWLMVSFQLLLGITATAVSLVYGVIDFVSVLTQPSAPPDTLLSVPNAINNIFIMHLALPLAALVVPALIVPFTWLYCSLRLRDRQPKLAPSH